MRITDEHIDLLRKHGFVLVEDLLNPEELAACRANLANYFPTLEQFAAAPERYQRLPRFIEFPFAGDSLNYVSTHPEIITFLERTLGTTELQLGESRLQAKYASASSGPDELMHCDAWGPNQLVYPRDDGLYRQVPMIIYYSEVTESLGPTFIVSQEYTRDRFLLPGPRDRVGREIRQSTHSKEEYPELYVHEQPVIARAGSLLIMSARVFHRGSSIRAATGVRFVHFLTYRSAATRWMRSQNWPLSSPYTDTREMHRLITLASPRQREMLGFPPPGHDYWNEETLTGVMARYPEMDMTPYREAAARRAAMVQAQLAVRR